MSFISNCKIEIRDDAVLQDLTLSECHVIFQKQVQDALVHTVHFDSCTYEYDGKITDDIFDILTTMKHDGKGVS